jgi:hypothetical protein
MKLCTVVAHNMQMYMKEYGCYQKLKRGDKLTKYMTPLFVKV